MVQLFLSKGNHPRGRGFFKLNTSLLKDLQFVNEIKTLISDTLTENQNLRPLLLWDFLKCQIRGKTISYASHKVKEKKNLENELIQEIAILEKRLAVNPSENIRNLLELKRKAHENIIEEKTAGSMLRSKARWIEQGEKNTKYFLNLEKRNYNSKVITKLKLEDGTEIKDPKEILQEEQRFYQNLYTSCTDLSNEVEMKEADMFFLKQTTNTSLNESEIQECEGKITERECLEVIKSIPNGKSPGTDGLPVEFYKVFWLDIKDILQSCYSYAFETGQC